MDPRNELTRSLVGVGLDGQSDPLQNFIVQTNITREGAAHGGVEMGPGKARDTFPAVIQGAHQIRDDVPKWGLSNF